MEKSGPDGQPFGPASVFAAATISLRMNTPPSGAGSNRRNRNPGFTTSAPTRKRAKVRLKLTPLGLLAGLVAVGGLIFLVARVLPATLAAKPVEPLASGGFNPAPPLAAVVTPIALPPAAGAIVINETFDSLGNWRFSTSSGPDYRISLDKGEYHAEAKNTALHNYFDQGKFDSGSVEVDARWVEGDDDKNARVGLVLRRTDQTAYYFEYYLFQNGFWVFQAGEKKDGKDSFRTLGQGNANALALRDPKAWQHLRVDMNGTKMKLFVNNFYLGEVDTPQAQKGDLGLAVTATDGKRTHMAFDNFTVRNLK